MHVVIRADGGPEIGYGHLVRSNALAEEILSREHKASIATTTPRPAESMFPDASEIIELPSRSDPDPFIDQLGPVQPDIVFTDAYPVDTEYQRAIRSEVPLAVLQDDARHAVCADVFVNGNLYASDISYEFVGQRPELCLGTEYVLLRSEVREYITSDAPFRKNPEQALVVMGGSDIANMTPTVIRAFDGFDLRVDAIVGPGVPKSQAEEVRSIAEAVEADVQVLRNPDDLVERMFRADFAVSTASSITYELLGLGTPIISIPVVDNQDLIANALRNRSTATVLERGAGKEEFCRAAREYGSSPDLRRKRQEIGQQLVDGQSTERTCSEILSVVENGG
ncbi:UDP-2,4-diacetamido-2,4,6-trideoxy-beta-L-altropyranose hydrolase [Halobacterium salinarum]|uniref:UDP-2,4-diacetamido-2,4, 6-trideoxy-beta-L-altropyranose hydrolase n=1 Tax=Halobacterium salinarum TaxID=2242 RepID=UPI0025556F8E|nr:UDP-2,4-diacetamido-2,4,6-trideoxy-beta-L-altropyranose hydrolase [Halobacterium salinarum]MDL0131504.1 UDP-2,4-diacetamido-2,4,6-trideoxy-beta-L-altropyranose hydrolase [Halobacterium salinarum]